MSVENKNMAPLITGQIVKKKLVIRNQLLQQEIARRKEAESGRLADLHFVESLDRVNRVMQGSNNIEQMMSDVLDTVLSIFGCDRTFLAVPVDPEMPEFTISKERTTPAYPGAFEKKVSVPMSPDVKNLFRELLRTPGPNEIYVGNGLDPEDVVWKTYGVKSQLAIALYPKVGKPWECGMHQCSHARVWTSQEKKLFQEISRRLADALTSMLMYRDLQRNEEEVRAANERYKSVLRAATGFSIIGTDTEGVIKVFNDGSELMLGFNADEVIDKMMSKDLHDPQEVAIRAKELGIEPGFEVFVAAARRGETEIREWTYIRKDGSRFPAQISVTARRDSEEKIIGFLGIGIDISQRKRAEEKLLATLVSRDSLIKEIEERKRIEDVLRKTNTDLKDLQAQLVQSAKMASLGQLAAGVAHEINNPIGFVNSNLGTLKKYIEDLLGAMSAYEKSEVEMTAETREGLTELKRQIDIGYLREDVGNLLSESMDGLQRVKQIVQNLKDFSHIDESEKHLANLEQGLDSTLNVVWNELKYKAEIVKEYGGIPEIECIPSQLNQVFLNLLINAAQAIESHGIITIRTGQEGKNVWVEIEDTGKGIKPEHLNRIFDPFFTTKPVGSGTGLGLSLSYGIVQKHGGSIEVKSEVGKSTVFRVVLPLNDNSVQSSEIPAKDGD